MWDGDVTGKMFFNCCWIAGWSITTQEDVWRLGSSTTQRREECCNEGSWKKNTQRQDTPTPPPSPSLPHQSKQQAAWLHPPAAPVEGCWPLAKVTMAQPPQPQPWAAAAAHCSLQAATPQWAAETGRRAASRKRSARARKTKLLHCLCVCVSCGAQFLFLYLRLS